MNDFLKLACKILNFDKLKSTMKVPFKTDINLDNGELIPYYQDKHLTKYRHIAKVDSMQFEVIEKIRPEQPVEYILIISGSIHKNHFNGSNYRDFPLSGISYQIEYLTALTGLNANDMYLRNLEVGINVETDFKVYDFLSDNLIHYKGKEFSRYDEDSTGKCLGFYRDLHKNYIVKVYDKGLQYDLPYNLLRFEIKFRKMQSINKVGIYSLADLSTHHNQIKLVRMVVKKYDCILMNETLTEKCNHKNKKYFTSVSNPKYWTTLQKQKTNIEIQNEKKKFALFKKKYCSNVQNLLKDKIVKKFDELLSK